MTEQLKPCPFCGRKPKLERSTRPGSEQATVKCGNWGCYGSPTSTKGTVAEAVTKWNHRPEEDRLRAIVEAQRELIAALEFLNTLELRPGEQANTFHAAWRKCEVARAKLAGLEGV